MSRSASRPTSPAVPASGSEQRGAVLDVGVRAYAEAAADIPRVRPELRFRQAENRGEARQDVRYPLRARVKIVYVVCGVVRGEARLGLHRVADHALGLERQARHV